MQIKPTTQQIDRICGNNIVFRERLINVLKKELPEEAAVYKKNLESGNYLVCSEKVHKLKHKISILGLEEAYNFASSYEEDLKNFNASKSATFEEILNEMMYFTREL